MRDESFWRPHDPWRAATLTGAESAHQVPRGLRNVQHRRPAGPALLATQLPHLPRVALRRKGWQLLPPRVWRRAALAGRQISPDQIAGRRRPEPSLALLLLSHLLVQSW